MRTLLVGTRASVLARTQAGTVSDALTAGGDPAELHFVHTPGDASQKAQTPVNRIGVGVFTETLRNALAAGECDVAVHSFKDLPTAPDPRFIQVVPLRADAREVLVSLDNIRLRDLPQGAQIGTGAPRRVAQIRGLRPDLGCVPIRGNIDTRMGRVGDGSGEGDLAAVVLARAGLERVGGLARAAETVDPADIMPAPAQGALCVEVRADDAEAVAAVRALDDHVSHARAVAEASNGRMLLRGGVFALDGSRRLVRETTGAFDGADHDHAAAAELGARIGRELLEEGAAEIMAAAAPSGPL